MHLRALFRQHGDRKHRDTSHVKGYTWLVWGHHFLVTTLSRTFQLSDAVVQQPLML
jgi:hypothetical protein